jgi:hypothetical protein
MMGRIAGEQIMKSSGLEEGKFFGVVRVDDWKQLEGWRQMNGSNGRGRADIWEQ